MILFTILLIALIAIAICVATLALVGAGGFVIVFGDVIAFGLIVWLIVKAFKSKKGKAQ